MDILIDYKEKHKDLYEAIDNGEDIARAYLNRELVGWNAEQAALAKAQSPPCRFFKLLNPFRETSPKRMLYDITRKVLGHDTPNYPQQIGDCYIADTMVSMHSGAEKPIQKIEIGETVLNHLGQPRKVIDKIHKKFSGDLVTIKLKGWSRTVTATETHNALFLINETKRFDYRGFGKKTFGEFQEGDYVMMPYGQYQQSEIPEVFDLSKYTDVVISDDGEKIRRHLSSSKWINRYVFADKKLARLLGLYLAEGGCEKTGRITFSYNSNETDLILETKTLLYKIFGLRCNLDCNKPHCISMRASSIIVTNFIKHLIPGNVYNKNVPEVFFRTPARVRKALLRGWVDGDGHLTKKRSGIIGVSSSETLRHDIARLCLSLKIKPSLLLRKKSPHQRVAAGSVNIYGEYAMGLYKQCINEHVARKITINKLKYGFARKIEEVTRQHVEDFDVYCIQVENEGTLVVNGIGQYNCVSFGGKNATEYTQCNDILTAGKNEQWKPIFPPYYYGTSRCLIGGQHDRSDGSSGEWLSKAAVKYGGIFSDTDGLPAYSGKVASDWGYSGPPKQYITVGEQHLIKTIQQINDWDSLCSALDNGYPCTVASDVGYEMNARSDGFFHRAGAWGHQMTFIGFGTKPEPYAIILNNWGPTCHGVVKDFDDPSIELPGGVLRVRRKDAESHIAAGETYAWSQYDGMPAKDLDKLLFKIAGV